jgi:hypothetical protein
MAAPELTIPSILLGRGYAVIGTFILQASRSAVLKEYMMHLDRVPRSVDFNERSAE